MIDYLFDETYYFQSILGVDRYTLNEKTSTILLDYLEQYPERREVYFEKTMDFLASQIENVDCQNITPYFDENILMLKTESVVRFCFDMFLMVYEKFGFIDGLFKKLQFISLHLSGGISVDYKYLLEEEKYKGIAVLFNS